MLNSDDKEKESTSPPEPPQPEITYVYETFTKKDIEKKKDDKH